MPLEDFFIAYGKQDRKPGELVWRIDVPKLKVKWTFAYPGSKNSQVTAVGDRGGRLDAGLVDGSVRWRSARTAEDVQQGLAAATGLAERGVAVTVLEARGSLGGRVRAWCFSFTDRVAVQTTCGGW